MIRVTRSVWAVLTWMLVAVLPVQFYLAGRGAFGFHEVSSTAREDAWAAHAAVGSILGLVILLALITALAGRLPRRVLGLQAAVFVDMIVQMVLPGFGDSQSTRWIAAAHPVNALLLTALAVAVAMRARPYLPIARYRDAPVSGAPSSSPGGAQRAS